MRGPLDGYSADISALCPGGVPCAWLRRDVTSGVATPEGPVHLGWCSLYSLEAYDRTCDGCDAYRRAYR